MRQDLKRKLRNNNVSSIIESISENNDNTALQASALGKILLEQRIMTIVKLGGSFDKEDEDYKVEKLITSANIIKTDLIKDRKRGTTNDNQKALAEKIVSAFLEIPENETEISKE